MNNRSGQIPQTGGGLFLTDGGLETTLVFQDRRELPCFAAFPLLQTEEGYQRLVAYSRTYFEIARRHGLGFVLESATWRASRDWGAKLGFDEAALAAVNRRGIEQLEEVRAAGETAGLPLVVSGAIGPRGDGYQPGARMTPAEAEAYHRAQLETFAQTTADMAAAFTLNYTEEAIGIARAARACGIPIALSFTLETDGKLPSGESLAKAIQRTDAETDGYPVYYMLNCAHPAHFAHVLTEGDWRLRIRGVRANASRRSHAELDESTELDAGDPQELAGQYRELRALLPNLTVVGGCCGTDDRHLKAIAGVLSAP